MKEEEMLKHTGLFGADYLMIKPFQIKTFRQLLSQYLGGSPCLVRSSTKGDLHSQRRKKILVVDDDRFSTGITSNFLKVSGHCCSQFYNGADAQRIIEESHSEFFLVLMDAEMPVMNGYQSVEQIRLYEGLHNLKPLYIVCVSGYSDKEHIENCKRIGFDHVITKPINKTELLRHIDDVMEAL